MYAVFSTPAWMQFYTYRYLLEVKMAGMYNQFKLPSYLLLAEVLLCGMPCSHTESPVFPSLQAQSSLLKVWMAGNSVLQ